MPIHVYECPLGHQHEEIFLSYSAVVDAIKCDQCDKKAEKIPAVCGVAFQPYRFAADGFAGREEREAFVNNLDKNDLGASHRENLRLGKLPATREWTSYKGTKIMTG